MQDLLTGTGGGAAATSANRSMISATATFVKNFSYARLSSAIPQRLVSTLSLILAKMIKRIEIAAITSNYKYI